MKQKKVARNVLYILMLMAWTGVVVIASQLIVGYLMIWILGKETFIKPVPTAFFSAFSYVLAMILIILIPPKLKAKLQPTKGASRKKSDAPRVMSREKLGLKNTPTWGDIGLAPVGYFAYLLLASLLTFLFSFFPWFNMEQAQDVGFSVFISGTDKMIAFLVLVVVAPIAEEVIFRGWLYAKIREKTSEMVSNVASMLITILLVSLLFGLVHMQWNIGIDVFALSVVLCVLREVTDTIYAGILLHMLKNGVAFFLLYVVGL